MHCLLSFSHLAFYVGVVRFLTGFYVIRTNSSANFVEVQVARNCLSVSILRNSAIAEIACVVPIATYCQSWSSSVIFDRWQCGSIASVNLTQLAPKAAVFCEVMRNDALRDRSRSLKVTEFGTDRQLVELSHLTFASLLNSLWILSGLGNLTLKLETPLYRVMHNIFRYIEQFRHGSEVWQTGRQTNGITTAIACVLRHALKIAQ